MYTSTRRLFTILLALATAGCELIDDLRPPHGGGGPGPATPPSPPPQACTLIGCQDQLTVTVTPAGGVFPSGVHVVTASLPGPVATTLTCEFSYDAAPGSTTAPVAKCTPGLRLFIFQKQNCTTVQRGDAVGRVCEPVAGQYQEQIAVDGTPSHVRLTQTVNGSTILDEALSPTYVETRPNGPNCEPVCRQATKSIELTSR